MTIGGRSRVATPILRVKPPAPMGPVMLVAYRETFPNDGAIGTATEDLNWISQFGTPTVAGGLLTPGASDDGGASAEHDTATDDMYVQMDVVSGLTGTDNQLYLVSRTDDAFATGVVLNVISGIAGATTLILIYDWSGAGVGHADMGPNLFTGTWRLEVEGNEGRAYRDDVLMATEDITGFSGAGKTRAGFEVTEGTGGSPTFDNFEYYDL